jgi:hypothetical protein
MGHPILPECRVPHPFAVLAKGWVPQLPARPSFPTDSRATQAKIVKPR